MTPKRIQLRRTKGWRKPPDAINVARPTRWGNPWRLDAVLFGAGWPLVGMTPTLAVELFRAAALQGSLGLDFAELRGHDLACWCDLDAPCHADVLLDIANAKQVAP